MTNTLRRGLVGAVWWKDQNQLVISGHFRALDALKVDYRMNAILINFAGFDNDVICLAVEVDVCVPVFIHEAIIPCHRNTS